MSKNLYKPNFFGKMCLKTGKKVSLAEAHQDVIDSISILMGQGKKTREEKIQFFKDSNIVGFETNQDGFTIPVKG